MAASASPPDDREHSPELGEDDDPEMTSIMNAEQRKELQKRARESAARKEPETPKEPERVTARPPAAAAPQANDEAMAIPKAAAIPAEARAAAAKAAHTTAGHRPGFRTWELLAFALFVASLLAAAFRP